MSFHLICPNCAQCYLPEGTRLIFSRTEFEPAEFQRLVTGLAKTPTKEQRQMKVMGEWIALDSSCYECDFCNTKILPGSKCAALTVWLDTQKEPKHWEDDFITVIREGQNRNAA